MKNFILMASIGLLFACSSDEKPELPQLPLISSTTHTAKNISDFSLYHSHPLITSETQGLQLLKSKQYQSLLKGGFGQVSADQDKIILINESSNSLDFLSDKNDELKKTLSIHPKNIQLDGFCFYDSPLDGNRYAFLLDGDGTVEQFIYQETDKTLDKPLLVRNFYIGPDVDTCLADNQRGHVYFMEPAAGLWRYLAEPESVLERQLIHAVKPVGLLPEELTSLAWVGDLQLAAVIKETNQYVVIDLNTEKNSIETYAVDNKERELERLKANKEHILLFDGLNNQHIIIENTITKTLGDKDKKSQTLVSITADVETTPVDNAGDAADDPAIWRNHNTPRNSLILGTNKKKGLRVYNLKGDLVQSIDNGKINNVDLRYNLQFNGTSYDVAAASNRSSNSISVYLIDQNTGKVTLNQEVPTNLPDVYGLCMGKSDDGFSVWINDKSGLFREYTIANNQKNQLKTELGREFKLPSQPEGCVVDQKHNQLFAGEEDEGIWLIDLNTEKLSPTKIATIQDEILVDDIEGLDIAYAKGSQADLLVVSSQGDNTYVLMETAPPYKIVNKFRVKLNSTKGIDGVSETDGLAVTTESLGREFPNGILVVQDGFNLMPNEAQNFKVIAWDKVTKQIKPH